MTGSGGFRGGGGRRGDSAATQDSHFVGFKHTNGGQEAFSQGQVEMGWDRRRWGVGGWRGEHSVTSGGGVTPLLSPLRDALAAHNDAERKEEKVVSKRVPDPLEKTFSSC